MNKSIRVGMEIRNKLFGNSFSEAEANRLANKANSIINDLNRSKLDENYTRLFTDEDVIWADAQMVILSELNNKVEAFIAAANL
jgi:hypothetical protein